MACIPTLFRLRSTAIFIWPMSCCNFFICSKLFYFKYILPNHFATQAWQVYGDYNRNKKKITQWKFVFGSTAYICLLLHFDSASHKTNSWFHPEHQTNIIIIIICDKHYPISTRKVATFNVIFLSKHNFYRSHNITV